MLGYFIAVGGWYFRFWGIAWVLQDVMTSIFLCLWWFTRIFVEDYNRNQGVFSIYPLGEDLIPYTYDRLQVPFFSH